MCSFHVPLVRTCLLDVVMHTHMPASWLRLQPILVRQTLLTEVHRLYCPSDSTAMTSNLSFTVRQIACTVEATDVLAESIPSNKC